MADGHSCPKSISARLPSVDAVIWPRTNSTTMIRNQLFLTSARSIHCFSIAVYGLRDSINQLQLTSELISEWVKTVIAAMFSRFERVHRIVKHSRACLAPLDTRVAKSGTRCCVETAADGQARTSLSNWCLILDRHIDATKMCEWGRNRSLEDQIVLLVSTIRSWAEFA